MYLYTWAIHRYSVRVRVRTLCVYMRIFPSICCFLHVYCILCVKNFSLQFLHSRYIHIRAQFHNTTINVFIYTATKTFNFVFIHEISLLPVFVRTTYLGDVYDLYFNDILMCCVKIPNWYNNNNKSRKNYWRFLKKKLKSFDFERKIQLK